MILIAERVCFSAIFVIFALRLLIDWIFGKVTVYTELWSEPMITYLNSNLFYSPAQVLVNTVNTEGVMGKGIAKEFKKLFPAMFKQYQDYCEQKKLSIGTLYLYKTPNKWVLNFPTKKSWRNPSKLEYLELGLQKFVENYTNKGIHSIAFPPLGCGNGELDWETDVKPLMEKYLKPLPIDIYIHLYTPPELDDVPEHKHIKSVTEWLKQEPQLLGFFEVLEDLKRIVPFDPKIISQNILIDFTSDEYLSVKLNDELIQWSIEDLVDVWSMLRNGKVLTQENVPSNLIGSYTVLIDVLDALPYVSKLEANTNYKKFEESDVLNALQFVPQVKSSLSKDELVSE